MEVYRSVSLRVYESSSLQVGSNITRRRTKACVPIQADPNARTALEQRCYVDFRLLRQAGWRAGRALADGRQIAWSPSREPARRSRRGAKRSRAKTGGGCAGFIFGRVATVSTAQPGEVASGKVTTVLAAREGLKPQKILSGLRPRAEARGDFPGER